LCGDTPPKPRKFCLVARSKERVVKLTEEDVVLVTGGASGLGEATVRAVVAAGARAVIVDLASSRGSEIADELGSAVSFASADVRNAEQVQAAVDAAVRLGTLRVAVNCAGIATPGRILGKRGALPIEDFRTVVEINLIGTFNVLRLAAATIVSNEPLDGDRGVIVMTASVAAFDGQIGQAAYAASKGGIASLTLSAARDLADEAIRVMTIAPGVMETPMMAGLPGNTKSNLQAIVPHPSRLGRPSEYALLVEQIIANPLLNGEVIRLDGALRMPPR
jgi:NAD(P)-dependent dehydrogenase (short-subunit alcohol dehydrogenase family)